MLSQQDCIYFAGFFDGEGCILISHANKHTTLRLQLVVGGTCKTSIYWIKDTFGGSIYEVRRERPRATYWVWQTTARHAASILEAIAPYLKIKREEAIVAIEFQKSIPPAGGRGRLSIETLNTRMAYQNKLRQIRESMKSYD